MDCIFSHLVEIKKYNVGDYKCNVNIITEENISELKKLSKMNRKKNPKKEKNPSELLDSFQQNTSN